MKGDARMRGTVTQRVLGGRTVWVYRPAEPFCQAGLPVAYTCAGPDLREALPAVLPALEAGFGRGVRPFLLAGFAPVAWERDFTPWAAPPLRQNGAPFCGGAAGFFDFVACRAVPWVEREFGASAAAADRAVAGYSLGGLAALWETCRTPLFGACASLSGSLWYDGFLDWMQDRAPALAGKRVYLSLGRAEPRTRDARMRTVGACTRRAGALAAAAGAHTAFFWNSGGHFTGIPARWEQALRWLFAQTN